VPDHLLGRVNAGYRLVAWGTMPLGAGLAGVVGGAWGLEAVFWTSAALGALCFPLVLVVVTDTALAAAEPERAVHPS
jgi:MFS family permease